MSGVKWQGRESMVGSLVAPVLVALALAAVYWLITPVHRSLMLNVFIFGLFAMAFDLLFGYSGLLSLGQSVYFGLGAYGTALAIRRLPVEYWLAVPMSVLIACCTALLIGVVAVRVRGHGFIIVTAVTALIFYLLALDRDGLTGGDEGLALAPISLQVGNWAASCSNPGPAYFFVLACVTAAFITLHWLTKTPFGLALRAVRDNESRAQLIGYNVDRLKLAAFLISGAFSSLAGGLYALTNCHVSTNLFDWRLSVDVILSTLVGGAGTLVGPLLGTFLLSIVREVVSGWWRHGYPILIGISIILVGRFFPLGLLGTLGIGTVTNRWRRATNDDVTANREADEALR